ncbi:MAG: Ni/Fe-hydrogenase cytochrome b subunit, partial [Acidobacteria bacterium]
MTRRLQVFRGVLWAIVGLAAAVTVVRFTRGLGTTTALSDTTPWGLWVGFDVMGGVALAAGGFVVAAIVHIFHRERYRRAARPAILTAMLGYAAVVVGLLYDLGLPWNIWHPVVFWNPRSPLFEVAWCVMLYLTVLILEFLPVALERTRFQRLYRGMLRLQLPLIVIGIALSTLHQSSLGTLLLIMPFRLHGLWYTSLLPEIFFVSAICLGLVMVILESAVTAWMYRRRPETDLAAGLARFAAWGLAFYLVLRIGDLARQNKLALMVEGSFESRLFWI